MVYNELVKLGVISDTHDNLRSLQFALTVFKREQIGGLIHCGDWVAPFSYEFVAKWARAHKITVWGVFGNNVGDKKKIIAQETTFRDVITLADHDVLTKTFDDKTAAIYHGHDTAMLDNVLLFGQYDVVFIGHTHKSAIVTADNGTLVINPGTTCFAVEGQVVDDASIAVYDTASHQARLITYAWGDI